MLLSDINFTDKMRAIIADDCKVLFAEGSMNSGKSFIQGIAFYFRVFNAPKDDNLFVLAGRSSKWLGRYIQDPSSFINLFKLKYKPSGTGGAHIEVPTKTGIKRIYLLGYDNKARWGDILGLNIKGFLIEEINRADYDFVKQAFGRISRFESAFMYCNSNGGSPDDPIYKDYLNRCVPILELSPHIPDSTVADMEEHREPKSNWHYYFHHFEENEWMSQTVKDEQWATHPKGTWDYLIYTLGQRGESTGTLFAKLLTKDIYGYKQEQINWSAIQTLEVGMDMGGTSDTSALTILTITGFTKDYQSAVVIACDSIEGVGRVDDDIVFAVNNFIRPYYKRFKNRIKNVWVDNMEGYLVNKMKRDIEFPGIKAGKAKKQGAKRGLKDRITLLQNLLNSKRMIFCEEAQETVNMLRKILTDGKDGHIDNNDPWNDYYDALMYTITPHVNKIGAQKPFMKIELK